MPLFDRVSRAVRANINSLFTVIKTFTNDLVKPVSSDFFDQEDVNEVIQRGISRKDEYLALLFYLKYAKSRKAFRDENFSSEQIFEIARDLGIPREFARIDLKDWLNSQHRRKRLKEHLGAFLIFHLFIVTLTFIIGGSITSILYITLAWSIALLVLFFEIREIEAEESVIAFQKWIKARKIESELQALQSDDSESANS